ncbi:glutamine--fructose-6-phosphate transaminase (isomerizing) [Natranaerobius thermophilus]|uniref:Glutamine--fructose-6-phosphate aminotransferase [isomerizing] n=1 Tax=Natranaerobius thermophilus (strain ATCC BAA-1301 / DSM 18059 / JW/NM-WN-LF) TaxID=457570 RepID=B2A4S1_NATTJ|nr:glutamine--fructose-6-phosphate transaminase (isomerizing) [Natranaerobius thermophilus]ACB83843.1 glutamine--fructose-6-phosphate transaminase [Natranaerobius thermophilus JW/NM-WN-LF]
MCGIVGYIGDKLAIDELIKGLKKLEYRGYDSAGVAIVEKDDLKTIKTKGRLTDLEERIDTQFTSTEGIGHTRWATHGKPSEDNSHPHSDCFGNIAVVHNGIIENFQHLKAELQNKGHKFTSQTDTEVIAHLLEEYYQDDLLECVFKVIERLEGSYALAIMHKNEPGKIICARKDSPLIVGQGEGENVVASDIPAILDYTREALILDDGEVALVEKDNITLYNSDKKEIEKEPLQINWDAEEAEKGGYDHFMLKEIHEQPKAVRETIRGRIKDGQVNFEELKYLNYDKISQLNSVKIVACGTAYHAGLVGKTMIESLANIPVEVDIASEFRYRDPLIKNDDLVIVISQSGETADTLAALRESQKRGAKVLAITNVVGSSVSREADEVIYTWAGPEIAVASTKAYVTQLVVFSLLSIYFAQAKATIEEERQKKLVQALSNLSQYIEAIFKEEQQIEETARSISKQENVFFIGRALDWAVAEEGALKLKEISYIHAEAYAAGELKHGTLALIVDDVPVISLVTQPHVYDKMLSNLQEVKARGGNCIAVAFENDREIENEVNHVLRIPEIDPLFSPIISVVPLQLLSYYAAVARGTDVDKPRNLAKSVTVE